MTFVRHRDPAVEPDASTSTRLYPGEFRPWQADATRLVDDSPIIFEFYE